MAKLVSRYSSEQADTFRLIVTFTGKDLHPQTYHTVIEYIKIVEPHFRLRGMVDPFGNEPLSYDTGHMLAGFKQIEDGKLKITSLFLFQVCIGEIQPILETSTEA
jgi:hypothetical protein